MSLHVVKGAAWPKRISQWPKMIDFHAKNIQMDRFMTYAVINTIFIGSKLEQSQ